MKTLFTVYLTPIYVIWVFSIIYSLTEASSWVRFPLFATGYLLFLGTTVFAEMTFFQEKEK